ncbi:nuclear transport factor 2 [Phycomyces blakesleeanus]
MSEIDTIAKQFLDFYYTTFDSNRQLLAPIYAMAGTAAIINKLANLPFQRVHHKISTVDAQPGSPMRPTIIVTVTGLLYFDNESNPQLFTQTFQLVPENGSYYVINDIFRINLA